MDSLVNNWLQGRELTGTLNRIFGFRTEGIEFFLGLAAFLFLCFSLHMMMRNLKKRTPVKKARELDEFSLAAEKVRRAYAVFAWGFMSLSFMFSILLYLP